MREAQIGEGFTRYVEGRWIRGHWDAHGLQLSLDDKFAPLDTPTAILDVFEGRVKLVAFDQESDNPKVIVEFGDKGEILHVEIDGVPFANVVHRPG